ncbi:hypothetical protein HHK36_026462 [Tetracentron sinense]|uniref:Transcription factor CBF/NF-Y/archaeal histone domain-containing protein n=1 Tax=Tetracentron sinense TaxID=13715 RepID=A0A834YGX9_TETSI|nr:hypothetical protein HHK36_026462 [Tetracentron sinense]
MVDNRGSNPDSERHKYMVLGASGSGDDGYTMEQDRLLPIANVGRIMKQILPPNAKISKEAKEIMQECVSEFISFVTGEASGKCHKEKRKTVNGDDICWAIGTLGFDDYAEPLKRSKKYLNDVKGKYSSPWKIGIDAHSSLSLHDLSASVTLKSAKACIAISRRKNHSVCRLRSHVAH